MYAYMLFNSVNFIYDYKWRFTFYQRVFLCITYSVTFKIISVSKSQLNRMVVVIIISGTAINITGYKLFYTQKNLFKTLNKIVSLIDFYFNWFFSDRNGIRVCYVSCFFVPRIRLAWKLFESCVGAIVSFTSYA